MDNIEMTEQLFKAIDAIISERLKNLSYDKTIIGTIIENKEAAYGRYKVTTDSNIIFDAYSELSSYNINDKVYIRIPGNDYTKQKIIIGKYIPDNLQEQISYNNQLDILQKKINNLESQLNKLLQNI